MDVPLETIERAKAGNLQAREELLRAFAGPLRALVRRWGSPADPEDQLQELFAKVLRVLPQFEVTGAARLSTWIFTVAHRALLEQRRRPQLNVVPLEQATQIADQQCIHRVLEEGELRRRLEEAIAEAEGIPIGTVKSRLHRARARLVSKLANALEEREGGRHVVTRRA